MATHPTCDDPGATDDRGSRGGHLSSNEVRFFADRLRQNGDRNTQIVPNDLARQAALKDVHTYLLGP